MLGIYLKVKKYEIEPNIISKDLFYEVFLKQYCIDKYEEYDYIIENKGLDVLKIDALEIIKNEEGSGEELI